MQQYHKKSGIDSFKTRRHSSPLYFTLLCFYQEVKMLPNINLTSQILQVRSYVYHKNQKTNWIGSKGFDEEETVKKYFWQMLQNK